MNELYVYRNFTSGILTACLVQSYFSRRYLLAYNLTKSRVVHSSLIIRGYLFPVHTYHCSLAPSVLASDCMFNTLVVDNTSTSCDISHPIGPWQIPPENMKTARVARPFPPHAGDAIHPALWKWEGSGFETIYKHSYLGLYPQHGIYALLYYIQTSVVGQYKHEMDMNPTRRDCITYTVPCMPWQPRSNRLE